MPAEVRDRLPVVVIGRVANPVAVERQRASHSRLVGSEERQVGIQLAHRKDRLESRAADRLVEAEGGRGHHAEWPRLRGHTAGRERPHQRHAPQRTTRPEGWRRPPGQWPHARIPDEILVVHGRATSYRRRSPTCSALRPVRSSSAVMARFACG